MTTPFESLQRQIDDLRSEIDKLRFMERPNQATDTASTPTFTGIYPGTSSSYVKNYRITNLANNGLAALTDNLPANGFLFVLSPTDQTLALIKLQGTGHATAIVFNVDAQYTITATTVNKHNIYWSAGNARYELENKIGGARSYDLLFFGE